MASHQVFFKFKHWLIYVDACCMFHGPERWCIEKISQEICDLEVNPQVFMNESICVSCTSYKYHLMLKKVKAIRYKSLLLENIIEYVLNTQNNSYNVILNNCKDFAFILWNDLLNYYRNIIIQQN